MSGARGGGVTLNDFNTNTSGTGVLTRQQEEEMGAVGVGLQSGQAQGAEGATGSGGVIMAGGGPIGIQAGLPGSETTEAGGVGQEKMLCKTAGCSFYANPQLEYLCNDCYEDYYGEKIPEGN